MGQVNFRMTDARQALIDRAASLLGVELLMATKRSKNEGR